MAGILANSASKTMVSGDTSPDNAETGYLTGEQITLSVFPLPSTFSWGFSKPAGSARAALSGTESATPVFTPDVGGIYVLTVTADSVTAYVLRLSVTQVAITTAAEAYRIQPKPDVSITAPAVGEVLFFSEDVGRWRVKDPVGAVRDFDPGARTGSFTLVAGSTTIPDTSITTASVVVVSATSLSSNGDLTFAYTAGVDVVVTSTDGADASTYRFSIIG